MEKLRGTLVVEEINGRRGPFCVGMLQTSIGDFKVTDKELDQFTPGRYQGEFLIEELRTKTVPWRQGTFTYIQALIAEGGFLIDEEDQAQDTGHTSQSEPRSPGHRTDHRSLDRCIGRTRDQHGQCQASQASQPWPCYRRA